MVGYLTIPLNFNELSLDELEELREQLSDINNKLLEVIGNKVVEKLKKV